MSVVLREIDGVMVPEDPDAPPGRSPTNPLHQILNLLDETPRRHWTPEMTRIWHHVEAAGRERLFLRAVVDAARALYSIRGCPETERDKEREAAWNLRVALRALDATRGQWEAQRTVHVEQGSVR